MDGAWHYVRVTEHDATQPTGGNLRNAPDDELIRRYDDGETLASIGHDYGVTGEAVRQRLAALGRPGASGRQSARERRQARMEAATPEVVKAFRELRDVHAVASTTGVDTTTVRAILDDHDLLHQAVPKVRNKPSQYTDEEILDCIRSAASTQPQGLSHSAYDEHAKPLTLDDGRRWPTHQTATLRFGSWADACKAAGVEPGRRMRKEYAVKWDAEDCVKAVAAFLEESWAEGNRATVVGYDEWQSDREAPSAATVRQRLGGWSAAVRLAAQSKA